MTTSLPPSRARYPSLAGKTVLITGGATGIGAGLVAAFADQGAIVHFLDVQVEAGHALAAQLSAMAHPPVFHACDLCNLAELEAKIAAVGPVDVLVNNAASDDRHKLEDVTSAYFDERIAVNLKHLLFCAKAVAGAMRQRGQGVIINFGSISWHLGLPDLVLYETAKAGIEGMTRALARELGPDGIRVVCIIPGNVKTPRQMKWYTPEGEAQIVAAQCVKGRIEPPHVASLALFLASDDASMCTGQNYWIDAGWR